MSLEKASINQLVNASAICRQGVLSVSILTIIALQYTPGMLCSNVGFPF